MRSILAITKALSDLNRVRALCALLERGELCVCQIQELLSLAPSSTSKHLSVLASAGLLTVRKDGRWAYYRVANEAEMPEHASEVVGWVTRQAEGDSRIIEDRRRLDMILIYTPEELCQRQAKGIEHCTPEYDSRRAEKC